jgi:hypothetical protein
MAAALVAISTATDARADGEFTATGGSGSISVTANGPWHINKDGPWKVVAGGKTVVAKDKFVLGEHSATASSIPAGEVQVSVYVCNGGSCVNKTIPVTVK